VHQFEVVRHESGGGFGMAIDSPFYAVEAAKGVDNSAFLLQPASGLLVIGIYVAIIFISV
jgi:hypothetical protein